MNKLREGDVVKLRNGARLLTVAYASPYGSTTRVTARYNHNGQSITRYESDFVLADEDSSREEKGLKKMKGKLFQTNEDTPRFGVGLAIDSQGRYVLEMKNGEGIQTFDKKEIEAVMPFTFSVTYSDNRKTEVHYLGREGSVAVGDLLLRINGAKNNFSLAVVNRVNTKSDSAIKYFKGVKLNTEPLDSED